MKEAKFLQGRIEVLELYVGIMEKKLSETPKESLLFAKYTNDIAKNNSEIEEIRQLLS